MKQKCNSKTPGQSIYCCIVSLLQIYLLDLYIVLLRVRTYVPRLSRVGANTVLKVQHATVLTKHHLTCENRLLHFLWRGGWIATKSDRPGETQSDHCFSPASAPRMELMPTPLSSGRPGRSAFSHGKGMMTNPDSDVQSARKLPWQTSSDKHDATNRIRAELRSDPTNSAENIIPDMYYAKGNPDIFGPAPAMVQEGPYTPPAEYKQPVLRYGVDRQE